MRKITLKVLLLLTTIFTLAACGGDDGTNDESGRGQGNGNSNVTDNQNVNKNAATYDQPELSRLEFPHVKGGKSIVVVHSTTSYGVNYSIEWDCDKKAQRWTCYQMYKGNSVTKTSRTNAWAEDPDIPQQYRTTFSDYSNNTPYYERGHICPSADRLCSAEANKQTFYLSNMQPMYGNFNSGIWLDMENRVRAWNKDSFRDTLYVCKGGTIDSDSKILTYSTTGLIVPKYFFMAILCKNTQGYKAIAFWVEHENLDRSGADLRDYVVSIDRLEELTGIDFFCNLPDATEAHVERESYTQSWNW